MKPRIRVKFIGFDPFFPPRKQPFYRMQAKHFELVECERPDFVFDRGRPFDHWQYGHCVKILFMCENSVPDFNAYDYGNQPMVNGLNRRLFLMYKRYNDFRCRIKGALNVMGRRAGGI